MATKKFNIENQDSLEYQNEILKLTVLGGVKLDGLDRMRVTLKIELSNSSRPPVRHNLDLYNDAQSEKLIRKTAERLEIGTNVIAASFNELIEHLENYRLKEIELQESEHQIQSKPLTEKERKEAKEFLSLPNLIERTNIMIGKSGMIGEDNNRLLMYLIFTSRKLQQPLHVVSLGASGTGKTHLQEKVGELIPEEDTLSLTSLSENSFYYFGQRELKNKLILIEDLDGLSGTGANQTGGAFYALRELQSKRKITKTIAHKNSRGETRTMHLVVEGPVSVSGCTTKEEIYEDNANRSFLIYLDESEAQDNRIMEYQRRASAGKIDFEQQEKVAELLKNTQRVLQPIKVINPYAEALAIPKEVFKPRRTNNHYLQFIEVVTYYHQLQRESKVDTQTGEIYIETSLEDIAIANKLLKEILLRKSDELSGACRNYLEKLKQYLKEESEKDFMNREISLGLRISGATVKRHHLELYNHGYIQIVKKDKLKGYQYQISSYEEYEMLKDNISNVLDENLKQLKSSSSVAQ